MRDPILHYRLTSYDRRLVPNLFVAALDVGVLDRHTWAARSGASVGHPVWGWLYHSTLMALDPDRHNTIIETGTNLGSSTMIIAQAIVDSGRDAAFHTIEIDPELHGEARRRFEMAGVADVINAHCGDALEVLPELVKGVDEIAIAFLDGNHLHDHVVYEFDTVVDRMRRDGVVVFDNTWLIAEGREDPRVNGALRTILARHGGNLVNFPFCSWYTPGVAVWQRQAFASMTPPLPESFDNTPRA